MASSSRYPLLLLGLAILLCPGQQTVQAQTRERGPIILALPASTRALSLGNSFAFGFPDSDAVFYHPGVLGRVQGLSGSVQLYGSSSTLTTFSAGSSWLSGGVALGVQHLSYGAEASEPISGSDLLGLSPDAGSLREDGNVGASDLVASVGYGRTVKGIQIGFVAKLIEERFGPLKSTTGAVDLGIAASPGPVTMGLSLQNFGPGMTFEEEEVPLPLRVALGASTQAAPVGPLDLSASAALRYEPCAGDLIPSLGLEVGYWPVNGRTFIGRIGIRNLPAEQTGSPFTFGGAFMGDDLIVEYAYEGFDSGRPAHRFGLGWR